MHVCVYVCTIPTHIINTHFFVMKSCRASENHSVTIATLSRPCWNEKVHDAMQDLAHTHTHTH